MKLEIVELSLIHVYEGLCLQYVCIWIIIFKTNHHSLHVQLYVHAFGKN